MATPKQPQDHLPPKSDTAEAEEEFFSFEAHGETYTFPNKTADVITPGYNRRHRHLEDEDRLWTMIEDLAQSDDKAVTTAIMDAFERMSRTEFQDFQKALHVHLGGTPGE